MSASGWRDFASRHCCIKGVCSGLDILLAAEGLDQVLTGEDSGLRRSGQRRVLIPGGLTQATRRDSLVRMKKMTVVTIALVLGTMNVRPSWAQQPSMMDTVHATVGSLAPAGSATR